MIQKFMICNLEKNNVAKTIWFASRQ